MKTTQSLGAKPTAFLVILMLTMNAHAFSPVTRGITPRNVVSSPLSVHVPSSSSSSSNPALRRRPRHGVTVKSIKKTSSTHLSLSSATTLSSSSPSPKGTAAKPSITTSLLSTLSFVAIDIFFRKLFKALGITSFPSSLGGCGVIFMVLLSLYTVNNNLGDGVYDLLSPGSDVLAKWLPVFFVPSLVTLPLAQSLGSSAEVLKVAAVIIVGFFFTLFSTAYSVIGVRKLFPSSEPAPTVAPVSTTTTATTTPPPKAFSDRTFNMLSTGTILSGLATMLTSYPSSTMSAVVKTPIQAMFMLFTTLTTFTFGARLPKKITSIVHPLIICTSLTLCTNKLVSLYQSIPFLQALKTYKVGSMCPVHLGAGDVLLYMLGPAVIALSCQMYNKKKLMKENIKEVSVGIATSSIGGLLGTSFFVKLLSIASPTLRLSCLSRNITSPLAMAISSILGGDVSLAVSMVVITGLIGANFGANILDAAGIRDPVARGLGIGSAAHGLGTAAFKDEGDAFPFAAIAMALTACTCTVLVSVPAVKSLIMKIALGV